MRRPRRLSPRQAAGAAAFGLWAAATAIAFVVRPGAVLELATLGVVGALAWPLAAARPTRTRLALAALFFAVPVVHTWPGRAWLGLIQGLPEPATLLLGASSLVGTGALLLAWRRPARPCSSLLLVSVTAFTGAAVVSSAASSDPAASAAAAWLALVLPILLGLLVAAAVSRPAEGWRLLSLGLLAALVPITTGIAAYVLVEGIPFSGADLAAGKRALIRGHLVHDVTFGNVGHLIVFALLLLPAALLAATRPLLPPAPRAGAAALLAGLVAVLAFTLGRAAIVVACLLLAVLALVALLRSERAAAIAATGAAALLAGVAVSGDVRPVFQELRPADGGAGQGGVEVGGVVVTEGSAVTRIGAIRRGLELSREHAPWGVGTGRYVEHDPEHGSPHSLALLLLAENGVLGAAGLLALLAYLVARAVALRRTRTGDGFHLQLACTAGALAFLTYGILAGAPLAVGVVNVWAVLLWLQVGLVEGLTRARAGP